jgi:tetratricopeptide (TPR) repeat protein
MKKNIKKAILFLLLIFVTMTGLGQTTKDFINKGRYKYDLKDYSGAINDFTKAISLDSNSDSAYYYRALAKGLLGDNEGSIADYTKSIAIGKMFSKASYVYQARGISKQILGDYRGSIVDFTKAISLGTGVNPENYLARGTSKGMLKDYVGAVADFTMVISYAPTNQAYYGRGVANLALHKKKSACLDFSKAGELGNIEAYDYIQKYCQ